VWNDANIASCLIGEESDEFVGQFAENGRRGRFVPQHCQFVGDEGVVGNYHSHRLTV
jgi:hypothetical protein